MRSISRPSKTSVDLDLQPDWHAAAILGLDSETELRGDRALLELCPPQPRFQNDTQLIEDWSDRTVCSADKVDVLRIAQRHREVQLVECRSATKP